MKRVWQVRGPAASLATVEALKAHLLQQLNLTADGHERFFSPIYDRDIFDPVKELHGVQEAVERIYGAVAAGQKIVVWGDYDADGVSSTAILVLTLEELGASVIPFLPHREEHGYGLHLGTLESLASAVDLVITCDCGVANAEEIAWLAKKGIDTIVIDHHSIPEQLPEAFAIVHPQHPHKKYIVGPLCGAGVSWKVASALLRDKRSPHHGDPDREKWLLDLAIIGTVADMVPLQLENRTIVQFGLEILRRTRRPGLAALLSALKLERATVSADDIAFKIAPRLNAPGRMDHPQPALDLLLTRDAGHADELVARLEYFNRQRQTVTARILKEVEETMVDEPVIFAFNNSWRAGVVGLAAGRLADKYGRPAVVVGSNGRHAVGSARSPSSVNVLQLLEQGRSLLLKLGGHAQAAGFSLAENMVDEFRARLRGDDLTVSAPEMPGIVIDAVLAVHLLTEETVHLCDSFAPFGEGNRRPTFLLQRLPLTNWRIVGKSGEHVKFTWEVEGESVDGIGFGVAKTVADFDQGMEVDVVGTLETNEWRGRRSLQVAVEEIAPAGTVEIVSRL